MDKAFEIFVTWQTIALGLACYMVVFVIRHIVETRWTWMLTNRYWRGIFLPIGPIATGVLIGIVAKMFPWPEAMGANPGYSARIIYGSICGLASGFIYGRWKSFVKGPDGKTDDPQDPTAQ